MAISHANKNHQSRLVTRVTRANRRAFTLLELTIVLGILTAFAMLSWPVLMKPWQRSEAQQAAETIREVLIDTRITAMTEGHTYAFRWKANTGEYEVVSRDPIPRPPQADQAIANPLAPEPTADSTVPIGVGATQMPTRDEALDLLSRQSDNQQLQQVQLRSSRLSADSIFFDAQAIESAFFHDDFDMAGERKRFTPIGNGQPDDEIRQRRERMESWRAINFYPDGRADNQTLIIRSTNDYEVELVLRGLTAGITVSGPRRVQRQAIDLNHTEQIDLENLTSEIVPDVADDDVEDQ